MKNLIKLSILPTLALILGCRVLVYENTIPATATQPAQTRKLTYYTTGLNTEMSGLVIETPNGKVGIGQHKSDSSRMLDTVDSALSKIPSPVSTSKTTIVQPK